MIAHEVNHDEYNQDTTGDVSSSISSFVTFIDHNVEPIDKPVGWLGLLDLPFFYCFFPPIPLITFLLLGKGFVFDSFFNPILYIFFYRNQGA